MGMPSFFNNIVIPEPTYVLQMLNGMNIQTWEVGNLKIVSQSNYKFISTSIVSEPDKSIVELEIKRRINHKDLFLTRFVLVEKIGNNKEIGDEDQMLSWSFQEILFNTLDNTRDFILTTNENSISNKKTWFLTQCSLVDFKTTKIDDISGKRVPSYTTITIKPKAILLYP